VEGAKWDGRVRGREVKVNDREGERRWREGFGPSKKIVTLRSNSGITVFVERWTHY